MTKALPYTEASIARLLKAIEKADLRVLAVVTTDVALIVGGKEADATSLVPKITQTTLPPPARRFGEKFDGGAREA
jgi:hypothetical protein